MSEYICPDRPTKKKPGQEGFFFHCYQAQMNNDYIFNIVITRVDQIPFALHRAQEEDRPLYNRPTVMPVSRHTGKKPE